jgi:predicted lipid-binding transport protein (Tim44 family)
MTPGDLKTVANAFVSLQQARHEADYDVSRTFRRQEVLAHVQSARQAFEAWGRVRKTDDARLYLACFLLWKRWDDEPR